MISIKNGTSRYLFGENKGQQFKPASLSPLRTLQTSPSSQPSQASSAPFSDQKPESNNPLRPSDRLYRRILVRNSTSTQLYSADIDTRCLCALEGDRSVRSHLVQELHLLLTVAGELVLVRVPDLLQLLSVETMQTVHLAVVWVTRLHDGDGLADDNIQRAAVGH